ETCGHPQSTRRRGDRSDAREEGHWRSERRSSALVERGAQMLKNGWSFLPSLIRDEEGASLVEYVLMVALIAVVCIAAVTLLGTAAQKKFLTTSDALNQQ